MGCVSTRVGRNKEAGIASATATFALEAHCIAFHRSAPPKYGLPASSLTCRIYITNIWDVKIYGMS